MRFRQFQNIWIKKSLHDITKKINIKNKNKECKNVICNSAQLGLIRQIDFFDKEIAQDGSIENYTIIKKNDFVYNPRKSLNAPYGPVNIYNYEEAGIVSPLYLCFSVHDIDKIFLHYYFKSQAWYRFIYLNGDSGARHDRVSIKDEVFFSQNLYLPNAIEQEKIGVFLTLIDQRIDTQNKIIEDLELFKKGIENQYFGYHKNNEYVILGDIITQVNNRNEQNKDFEVLSVSNKYGFIPQSEQFDDHEVASANKSNYKIVKQNDFAYNPARINVGSIAMLKNNQIGIVSPMYICFRADNNRILSSYLDYFSHSNKFNNEVLKNLEGSVRLCLSFESLSKIKIYLPSLYTQSEIIKDLDLISSKISIENKILEKLKEQKKYLLSNMFI